jgi:hypothetical protein
VGRVTRQVCLTIAPAESWGGHLAALFYEGAEKRERAERKFRPGFADRVGKLLRRHPAQRQVSSYHGGALSIDRPVEGSMELDVAITLEVSCGTRPSGGSHPSPPPRYREQHHTGTTDLIIQLQGQPSREAFGLPPSCFINNNLY